MKINKKSWTKEELKAYLLLFCANSDYKEVGATVEKRGVVFKDADILLKINPFDEDDLNLVLPIIKGLTEPIDLEATEEDRNNNQNDPINNLPVPNSKATQPKKADPTKLKVAPNKTSLLKSPAKLEKVKTKEN